MIVKKQFPFFKSFPNFIYADSAATTLKSKFVLKELLTGYKKYSLPAGKSIYYPAEEAYEQAQIQTKNSINKITKNESYEIYFAPSVSIIFDRLFFLLQELFLTKENIRVLLPQTIHTSITTPLKNYFSNQLEFIFFKSYETITIISFIDILVIPVIDHITGVYIQNTYIDNLKSKYQNTLFIIDASQSFSLFPYNLYNSQIDILIWSSHKMYGPDSVATIMIKKEFKKKIENCKIIKQNIKGLDNYFKFGSFSYPSLYAFQKTITWIEKKIYTNPKYLKKIQSYVNILFHTLSQISEIKIISDKNSFSIITFIHNKMHAHDVAVLFSEKNIGIRSGELCTHNILHKNGICRISLGIYNTIKEIKQIKKTIETIFALSYQK